MPNRHQGAVFWADVAADGTLRVDSVGDGFFAPSWWGDIKGSKRDVGFAITITVYIGADIPDAAVLAVTGWPSSWSARMSFERLIRLFR